MKEGRVRSGAIAQSTKWVGAKAGRVGERPAVGEKVGDGENGQVPSVSTPSEQVEGEHISFRHVLTLESVSSANSGLHCPMAHQAQ